MHPRSDGDSPHADLPSAAAPVPWPRGSNVHARPAEGTTPAPSSDPKRDKRLEKLWKSYRRRPSDALRNSLVEGYQDLVEGTVRRFAGRLPRSVDPGDLNTAANFGLMSAIESFDPDRGVRFETYGELRIKGALLDELRSQDWLPRPWRSRIERHKRALERLRSEQNPEPSDEEVARAMSIPLPEYRQFFGNGVPSAPTGSMPASDGAEELPGLDVFPDPKSEAAAEKLTRDELLQLVAQKLTEQEYRIVYLKYWEELPMREIGQLEGLSESRVCKIHTKLIERLRERLRANAPG